MAIDLSPLANSLTALITAGATLGAVAITSRGARKTEDKRVAVEQTREDARIARELEAASKDTSDANDQAATARMWEVANGFLSELSAVRAWAGQVPPPGQKDFAGWFEPQWAAQGEMRMRRALSAVLDDDQRNRLTDLLNAASIAVALGNHSWRFGSYEAERIFLLGFDLGSTYARNREPDAELVERLAAFDKDITSYREYAELQRQARIQALIEKGKDKTQELIGDAGEM